MEYIDLILWFEFCIGLFVFGSLIFAGTTVRSAATIAIFWPIVAIFYLIAMLVTVIRNGISLVISAFK